MPGTPEGFVRGRKGGHGRYSPNSPRDFIGVCEKVGQLKRVRAEVDWDLEIFHVCKIVEEKHLNA